jgi:hypothetical protein
MQFFEYPRPPNGVKYTEAAVSTLYFTLFVISRRNLLVYLENNRNERRQRAIMVGKINISGSLTTDSINIFDDMELVLQNQHKTKDWYVYETVLFIYDTEC